MPFCPICRAEFGSELEVCAICNSRLVDSLPDEGGDEQGTDLMELAQFSNVSEAEMIREILEGNAIRTIQRGEVDPIGIASGAEPITLLVEARFLPHALELYNAYYAGSGVEQPQPDQE